MTACSEFRVQNLEFRILKYILIVLSFLILHSAFLIQPVHAQTPVSSSLPFTLSPLPSTISPTSPLYTDLLINNMFHSFSCLAVGSSVIGQPCLTYQVTKNAQGVVQSVPMLSTVNLSGGTLGTVTSLIGALYVNPPIRTSDYLASVGQKLGIVKEAHAQGFGGSGEGVLHPIILLWQVARNVSYLIMIIIFVVIGLMVMFRNRINPQTVITAQAALPGLVIGLILITFSYFLASLITDFAFLATNLVGYYFSTASGDPQTNLINKAAHENVLSIFSRFTGIINQSNASDLLGVAWNNLGGEVQGWLRLFAGLIVFQQSFQATTILTAIPNVGQGIQALLSSAAAVTASANPVGIVGMAISFIAMLILIYSMFKLLLRLINNFLSIIFLTVTAPFQFLAASLPGRQGLATNWILNMLCNVLAFPAVMGIFYFVAFLLKNGSPGVNYPPFEISSSIPLAGAATLPLFGGLELRLINLLLAFGALVASPTIPDIICRTIGKVGQAGQMIGQEIGGGIGAGRGYSRQAQAGIGAASEQGARVRGMFSTPGYKVNELGQVVETYEPGRGSNFGFLARKGIIKPPPFEPDTNQRSAEKRNAQQKQQTTAKPTEPV